MFEDFRLKAFIAVAEEGSFTKAARRLGVSQPAVSQNIAELEKTTDSQLFERAKGSVVLTAKGKLFKEYAEQILHWYKETEDIFGTNPYRLGRKVRIAISPDLADILPPRISDNLFASQDATHFIILPYGTKPADIEIWSEDDMVKAQATKEFVHSALFQKILTSLT